MVTHGRVVNGVVVSENGVRLPEGQQVVVQPTSRKAPMSHCVLDIPTVQLGGWPPPIDIGDDLLGEMLDGRP